PAIKAAHYLALKAVYSETAATASALASQFPGAVLAYSNDQFPNLTALLGRSDITAVIIAMRHVEQPIFIRLALEAGKHVLSEMPILETLSDLHELFAIAATLPKPGPRWNVAEPLRFMPDVDYAAGEILKLGPVTGFWTRQVMVMADLLGPPAQPVLVVAGTNLVQKRLPPVDTVEAVWIAANGVIGSFGYTHGSPVDVPGAEHVVMCEGGAVELIRRGRDKVVRVYKANMSPEERVIESGHELAVRLEVQAWAECLEKGWGDPRLSPWEAIRDLEIARGMLVSGLMHGERIKVGDGRLLRGINGERVEIGRVD
ncbi:hypothetical protein EJ06DRAFT_482707, partial [Trichodelitschia bisporula]